MLRLLAIAGIVVVVLAAAAVSWVALDLPPLRLVVRHGFPPVGGPTGRVKEIEGVRFVEIGAGYFRMGSWLRCTKGDSLGRICKAFHLPWGKQPKELGDHVPLHWVVIREPYWIADCELTNLQYERFDPKHERDWQGNDDPVTSVSFDDAQAYCKWLATRSGLPARLPSEAEWENACRAGSKGEYCFGDDEKRLGEYAWFDANSGYRGHAVKTKRPNAWGLYDLHGNAWEWCEDLWHASYRGAPEDARAWTRGGASQTRIYRGGGWDWQADICRSAFRFGNHPDFRGRGLGFRPALGASNP